MLERNGLCVSVPLVCHGFSGQPTHAQLSTNQAQKLVHYASTGFKRKNVSKGARSIEGTNLAYMIMASLDDEPLRESKLGTKQYWDNAYAYVDYTGFIRSLCQSRGVNVREYRR